MRQMQGVLRHLLYSRWFGKLQVCELKTREAYLDNSEFDSVMQMKKPVVLQEQADAEVAADIDLPGDR